MYGGMIEQAERSQREDNMRWNRKYSCIVAGIMAAAVAGTGIGYHVIASEAVEGTENPDHAKAQEEDTGDVFTEEGTTQIKTKTQLPAFSVSAVAMTVEEVYVEAGTAVEEGDALLRLSDWSMEEAAVYYEEAVTDAREALETAELEFQSGVLEAEYELESTRLEAENAKDKYDASISSLTVTVEEKKEKYDEAVEEIQLYQAALDNGTYYVEVGAGEKGEAVDAAEVALAEAQSNLSAAQSAYETARTAFAVDMTELKNQINGNASYEVLLALAEQVEADYTAVGTAADDLSRSQIAADSAQSSLEMANQALESAAKEYNTKVEMANQKITELTENLEELQEAYEQAGREAVTAQAAIQKEYEEAVLEGKYADTTYEAALQELKDAVDAAQDTLDALLEEQEALLAIEDGVLCADRAGTIASVNYEAEDVLYENTALVSYYDTETIFISVEVPQEQIAMLTVGDEVEVAVTGSRGTVKGKISSIASSKTTGGSISNVTYAVIISIDNADGMLSSGSSATVTFDYGERTEAVEETEVLEEAEETEAVEEAGGAK